MFVGLSTPRKPARVLSQGLLWTVVGYTTGARRPKLSLAGSADRSPGRSQSIRGHRGYPNFLPVATTSLWQWTVEIYSITRRSECHDATHQQNAYIPHVPPLQIHADLREQVSRRAYALYEARGRTDGHDVEDWLQAEVEVAQSNLSAA